MTGGVQRVLRYPVKSLQGEVLAACAVGTRGLAGDREWAVVTDDGGLGSGKTTRRFRAVEGLLSLRATLDGDVPVVTLPDGSRVQAHDPDGPVRLSAALGRPVRLAREARVAHHDVAPVHLCTTATLVALGALAGPEAADFRRYRPNLVLDVPGSGYVEDAWVGRRLRIGEVELAVTDRTLRCVMVNAAQRGLDPHAGLLRALGVRDLRAGVYADVVVPGVVREGDTVTLVG